MLTNTERQQIVEEVNAGTYGIDEALDDIAEAQKGEEVRKALYAEALVLNREGHAGSTDMIARQKIANLQTSVNGQISTLRTEVGDDIDDLETALNSGLATQNGRIAAQNGKIAAQNASIANVVANYNVEYGSTELWASTGETGALAAGTTVTLSEDVSHFDYIDIYSFCGNSNVLDTVPVDAKLQSDAGYALRWVNLSDPGSGTYQAYVRIVETKIKIIGTTLTIIHQVTYRNGEAVNVSGAEITQSNRSTYVGELGIMKIVGRKITANTEIEDVRIGADGTEYASAGQAVRAQISDLHDAIPAIDTTLSVSGAAADAKIVGDEFTNVKTDFKQLVIKHDAIDWSNLGTADHPIGWEQGYYSSDNGEKTGSGTPYIRTSIKYEPDDDVNFFVISAPSGYAIQAFEYLEDGSFVSAQGNSNTTTAGATSRLVMRHTSGHKYSFCVGKFESASAAVSSLTSEFVSNVLLNSYSLVPDKILYDAIDYLEENYTEETRNLWQNDPNVIITNPNGFSNVVLKKPLPPGTYTISALISSDSDLSVMVVQPSSSQSTIIPGYTILTSKSINKATYRTSVSFTISETAYSIRFMTGYTTSSSEGHTGSVVGIQIEAGENDTEYIKPVTAVDRVARQGMPPEDGDQVTIYTSFVPGYIDTSGSSVDFNTSIEQEDMSHIVIKCEEGDEFKIVAIGGNKNRLQHVFTDSNGTILTKFGEYAESIDSRFKYNPERTVIAPFNAKYMIVNHVNRFCAYLPKVYKLAKNDSVNKNSGALPKPQFPSWKDNVYAVYKSMLVVLDDNKFRLSNDCGTTWNEGVDVSAVGDITRAYLFANGDLAFFTGDKAYYINDWVTYHEANFYEADGTTLYVPSNEEENFWCQRTYNERQFINGIDVYVFGNYHFKGAIRSIVWATFDRGKTYRIAWEFGSRGTATPEGSWQVRHVHSVYYYEPEDIYLVNTGDSNATECMLFGLKYENGQWTVTKIGGPARGYKWTSIGYWQGQLYYSNDNTYGSIWRCSYEDLGDLSKHVCVLDRMYNDSSFVIFGNNGEMICMTNTDRNTAGQDYPTPYSDIEAARAFWFSSDRTSFHELHMPVTFLRGRCNISGGAFPVASDGKLFGVVRNGALKTSLCLSDIVHDAGFKTAFCPRI